MVREGDLITLQPWEFQDVKANVCMRYTKTQSLYLSRKGVLPEIVDVFGMSDDSQINNNNKDAKSKEIIPEEILANEEVSDDVEIEEVKSTPAPVTKDADDDIDSFFG